MLTRKGALLVCGANACGRLGVGDTDPRPAFVRVGGIGPVQGVAVGSGNALALLCDGSLRSRGKNEYGCVTGDGSTSDVLSPEQPPHQVWAEAMDGARAVVGGALAMYVLDGRGVLHSVGFGSTGALGRSPLGDGCARLQAVAMGDMRGVRLHSGTWRACWFPTQCAVSVLLAHRHGGAPGLCMLPKDLVRLVVQWCRRPPHKPWRATARR